MSKVWNVFGIMGKYIQMETKNLVDFVKDFNNDYFLCFDAQQRDKRS